VFSLSALQSKPFTRGSGFTTACDVNKRPTRKPDARARTETSGFAMDLLREWSHWNPATPPFILESDEVVLRSERSARAVITIRNWPDAHRAADFCAPKDHRLHLGLLPQPFLGDLRRASVYVLLLNPGLGPTDYYGENEVPEYRKALLANLKQKFERRSLPFLFLDPQYAWHGGFGWWHGKLAGVISRLAETWDVRFGKARARLARELASIELLPYHSPSFRDAGGWIRDLRSVTLARSFVCDIVVPRVRRGEAIVIATRQAKIWNLPKHSGVVNYNGQQARAAHLSPNSPGGSAILRHLARKDRRWSRD
jgi:hypothetical protein